MRSRAALRSLAVVALLLPSASSSRSAREAASPRPAEASARSAQASLRGEETWTPPGSSVTGLAPNVARRTLREAERRTWRLADAASAQEDARDHVWRDNGRPIVYIQGAVSSLGT